MTQKELAALTDISLSEINRLEKGDRYPRPSTVRKLALALKVTPAQLYGTEAEPKAETPDAAPDAARSVEESVL